MIRVCENVLRDRKQVSTRDMHLNLRIWNIILYEYFEEDKSTEFSDHYLSCRPMKALKQKILLDGLTLIRDKPAAIAQ